jgi:hypothetical protein
MLVPCILARVEKHSLLAAFRIFTGNVTALPDVTRFAAESQILWFVAAR